MLTKDVLCKSGGALSKCRSGWTRKARWKWKAHSVDSTTGDPQSVSRNFMRVFIMFYPTLYPAVSSCHKIVNNIEIVHSMYRIVHQS